MEKVSKLRIDGAFGLDGEYEFDLDGRPFTNGELHVIKTVSGVRPGEFEDALTNADTDLFVGLAKVVLERHGKQVPVESLWNLTPGQIRFEFPEEEQAPEGDAVPPRSAPVSVVPESDENGPSGTALKPDGDTPPVSSLPSTGALR